MKGIVTAGLAGAVTPGGPFISLPILAGWFAQLFFSKWA